MKHSLRRYGIATVAAMAVGWLISVNASGQAGGTAKKTDTSAATTPRTADGHPDLTGIWRGGNGGGGSQNGPKKDANGNINVVLAARGGSGANFEIDNAIKRRSDPNKPAYKTEYIQKVKDLDDNEATEDPAFFCKNPGVPRLGAPSQIVQSPGQIVFLYANGNTFRVVPTDGRPHRKNLDETYLGDSIGHWEGDTLVVDVIGFTDDTWLDIAGYFHTTALHVTERLSRQGDTLTYQSTVEDPNVLVKPWVETPRTMHLSKDLLWEDPPCIEQDGAHLVTKEHH
jgi:hypothetical protein